MATQETIKQITQGGVTRDVEDATARQGLASKVDKNGTDSLMTAAEHTKLAGLPTADQLATQMNAKANDNVVVKTISVNGTTQTPVNGNVDISVEGAAGEDGITPHIGSNGNWWIGDTDTTIKAQGPAGSVTITDGDIDTLEVHNALNAYTGLLGMSGAMMIKNNIDSLYESLLRLHGKLANMAFWDATDQAAAAPTQMDWSLPKKTLTITNNISNSSIEKANGDPVSGSLQVDQGSTVTLIVKGSTQSYAITQCTASLSSGAVDSCVNNNDGTFTVVVTVSDALTLTLTGTATQLTQVNTIMKKVSMYGAKYGESGNNGDYTQNVSGVPMTLVNLDTSTPECSLSNTAYVDGQAFNATVNPASGYAIFSVKVEQNGNNITGVSYNPSTHVISVASPDNTLSITVIVAQATDEMFIGGTFFGCIGGRKEDIGQEIDNVQISGQIVTDQYWHCNSEFIEIPQNATHIRWSVSDADHKPYSSNQSGGTVYNQRSLIFYDEDYVSVGFLTYYDASKEYRELQRSVNAGFTAAKYVRASYVLNYGKIEFSSDGTNFTTAWEYTED